MRDEELNKLSETREMDKSKRRKGKAEFWKQERKKRKGRKKADTIKGAICIRRGRR